MFRPAASGSGYAPPTPLSPGFCPLSMLFSDWDGSGRRDLRISNDRQYYGERSAASSSGGSSRACAPRAYTAADGWALLRLWGMGIASYDLTGDGYPEVYLTSQGANTLQTLVAGPSAPAYHGMARELGVEATRPVVGGDPLPSTAWHPEFEDVNNDGSMDLLVTKGNVNEIPDYAQKDPNNLFLGRPDGTYAEALRGGRDRHLRPGPRGRARRLQQRRAARPRGGEPRDARPAVAQRRPRLGRCARRRWAAGSASGSTRPGTNRDAIGAVVETRVGDQVGAARARGRRRPRRRPARLDAPRPR